MQRVSDNDCICKVLLLYEDFGAFLDILFVRMILNIGCMDKDSFAPSGELGVFQGYLFVKKMFHIFHIGMASLSYGPGGGL